MIKDVFVLNKNSWHVMLIQKTYGLKPKDFSHMCPYFWLCVLAVLLSPITGFLYLLSNLFKKVFLIIEAVSEYASEKRQIALEKKKEKEINKILKNPEYLTKYIDSKSNNELSNAIIRDKRIRHLKVEYYEKQRIEEEKKHFVEQYSWEQIMAMDLAKRAPLIANEKDIILEKRKRLELERQLKIEREKRERELMIIRKNKIAKLANAIKLVIKFFGYIFFSVVGVFGLYFFGKFVIFLTNIKKSTYILIGTWSLKVVLTILAILILILLIKYLIKIIPPITISFDFEKINFIFKPVVNLFKFIYKYLLKPIFNILKYIFQNIKAFFHLVLQMFKNECPAIKWED